MKVITLALTEVTGSSFVGLFSSSPYALHQSEVSTISPTKAAFDARLLSGTVSNRLDFWIWTGESDGGGEFVLDNRDAALYALFQGVGRCYYTLAEGDDTQPYAQHVVVSRGVTGEFEVSQSQVRIPLLPPLGLLDFALNAKFGEGSDAQDKWQFVGVGSVSYALAIKNVNASSQWYLSGPQSQGITSVYANGASISFTPSLYGFTASVSGAHLSALVEFKSLAGLDMKYPADILNFVLNERYFVSAASYSVNTAQVNAASALSGELAWSSTGEEVNALSFLRCAVAGMTASWCVTRPQTISSAFGYSLIQLVDPASTAALATIDSNDIKGGINLVTDKAVGLSAKMESEISPGAIEADPQSGRKITLAESTVTLHEQYKPALAREPVATMLRAQGAAFTEIQRVTGFFDVVRLKSEFRLVFDFLPAWMQLGAVIQVIYPLPMFSAGRNLFIYGWRFDFNVSKRGYTRDLIINTWS